MTVDFWIKSLFIVILSYFLKDLFTSNEHTIYTLKYQVLIFALSLIVYRYLYNIRPIIN